MRKQERLYEVELKSKALLREGKKGFITYFKGGNKKAIAKNVRVLYPQWTKPEDAPMVNITPISYKEYKRRVEGGVIIIILLHITNVVSNIRIGKH